MERRDDRLLERYRQPLFALAMHTVGHREEALDVLQEACLRAMKRIGDLEDPLTHADWSNVPAFSKLGLEVDVNVVEMDETSADIEAVKSALSN